MTSGIRPFFNTPSVSDMPASGSSAPAVHASANTADSQTTEANEAVTLTETAKTSAQLLASARQSPGIDGTAVARLRSAIQNESFAVSPDHLAQAITTAHAQMKR